MFVGSMLAGVRLVGLVGLMDSPAVIGWWNETGRQGSPTSDRSGRAGLAASSPPSAGRSAAGAGRVSPAGGGVVGSMCGSC
jgi:hypothetical protein